MCNCCKYLTSGGLNKSILAFIIINLILSVFAIFIRAGKTDWYKKALVLLEERNNDSYYTFNLVNCKKGGLFKYDDYCLINGTYLYKPSEYVSNQVLYKKWKIIEIVINILRAILIVICLVYYFFCIKDRINYMIVYNNENNGDNKEYNQIKAKITNLLSSLLIIFIFFIVLCGIYILIRALSLTANMDIGLYEEGNQNSFESCTAINYILDITEIVLFGMGICFISRLKGNINRKQTPKRVLPVGEHSPPPPRPVKRPQDRSELHPIQIIPPIIPNININIKNENYGEQNIQIQK